MMFCENNDYIFFLETRKVTFESKISAKCSNGKSIPIIGVSACENFEDFTNYIKLHLREYLDPVDYPDEFKLYWLFKDQRIRLKVDESNWKKGVEDAQNILCMLYIYLEPHSSSPPKELTMINLKQHTDGYIPQYKDPTNDNETSSKNSSRDSHQQKVMNSEVTMRDGNKCVICEEATSLFAGHILELRDVKSLDAREVFELKLRLNISSMYGVDNGFTLCKLCHTMYDSSILWIRVDESGRFTAECDPACISDPLFSYRDHASMINNKSLRIPEPKFQRAWPPKEVVQWRYEDNRKMANERKAKCESMEFECTRCGEVFSSIKQLTNHLKRSKPKCSNLRETRKPGKYGGFDKVKMLNEERYNRCRRIVKDIFYGGKRSSSVNSSFVSTFSQMSVENNST